MCGKQGGGGGSGLRGVRFTCTGLASHPGGEKKSFRGSYKKVKGQVRYAISSANSSVALFCGS